MTLPPACQMSTARGREGHSRRRTQWTLFPVISALAHHIPPFNHAQLSALITVRSSICGLESLVGASAPCRGKSVSNASLLVGPPSMVEKRLFCSPYLENS